MALPTMLPGVNGSRIALGPELWQSSFLINPGYKDYPATGALGGYGIACVGFTDTSTVSSVPDTLSFVPFRLIQSVSIDGCNSTAMSWSPYVQLPISQLQGTTTQGGGNAQYSGAGFNGYQYFNFRLFVITTGVEVATSVDLSGALWVVTISGC
jgi:hypothetical protein